MNMTNSEKNRQKIEIIEQKETKGRNITLHVIFVRHGEKAVSTGSAETGLTKKGEAQARIFGANLEKTQAIKPYSSNTLRTVDTAKEAVKMSGIEKQMVLRIREELGFDYDKTGNFVQNIFAKKREILGENPNALSEEELNQRLNEYETYVANYFLSFGSSRPDPKTESPKELASKIAKRVNLFIRMPEKLNSNSDITLLNSTHDMCINAFLKEVVTQVIDGGENQGFEKIEDIGGPIEFTESFEIRISTNQNGDQNARLFFRGKEYEINPEQIERLTKQSV